MKVDFIIVGQGLAGTLLAFELFRQNKTLVIFDDPGQVKASEVAAGLINPVVFRRMTKSWLVDDAFPQMGNTYRQLEELTGEQVYFPGRIIRPLSEDESVFWREKAFANQLEAYLEAEPVVDIRNKKISGSFSFGFINKAGRADLQKLIASFSDFLKRKNSIRREKLDCEKLVFQTGSVGYKDVTAEKVIFCEGPAASQNPFFRNLKFKHSKGEILELKIPDLHMNEIVSKDVFVMPAGDNRYKVGASYSWDELNSEITGSARQEILFKLKAITQAIPEVLGQKAGIRPTMHDRKPVIGLLPKNRQIGIFNGLGSKGVLLGPFLAHQFAEYLTGKSETIHPEANIQRYFR